MTIILKDSNNLGFNFLLNNLIWNVFHEESDYFIIVKVIVNIGNKEFLKETTISLNKLDLTIINILKLKFENAQILQHVLIKEIQTYFKVK